MKKVIVIIGKSGAGKDTAARLLESLGVERIVTHTSRPMRTGEQEGREYYYHTQEEFDSLRDSGYFAETRDYDAKFGHCSYGTSKESLCEEGLRYLILPPPGYESLISSGKYTGIVPVYLRTNDDTLRQRLGVRLENETNPKVRQTLSDEISRRLEADRKDFSGIDAAADGHGSSIYDRLMVIPTDNATPQNVADTIYDMVKQIA